MSKVTRINYIPVAGYILVEPLEETSVSGLNVVADEFPQLARVVKTGESTFNSYTDRLIKCPVKEGDIILHSSFGFEKVRHEGVEYRIVPFEKVLAIRK